MRKAWRISLTAGTFHYLASCPYSTLCCANQLYLGASNHVCAWTLCERKLCTLAILMRRVYNPGMMELDHVWLEKADENLEAAQSEFVNRRYNSCANRAYYACFQAAIYALSQAGIRPRGGREQWGHDFVQAHFNGQLINRRKLYPTAIRSTLNQTYTLRERADYTTDRVNEVRAARAVGRSEEFVQAIMAGGETQ